MKQVISKEDVAGAIAALRADGKKPTLAAVHAALRNRGSMSTLVRLKAEIEADEQKVSDCPEALQAFREVWAAALDEGRKQQEERIEDLGATVRALASENERLEGTIAAVEARAAELEQSRLRVEGELNHVKSSLADALQRLADAQQAHGTIAARLQADLDGARREAHAFELELARSRTLLEVKLVGERNESTAEGAQPQVNIDQASSETN